jgi:hypothetical protein
VSQATTEGIPTEEIIFTMRSSFASFSTPEQIRFPDKSRRAYPVFIPASTPAIRYI